MDTSIKKKKGENEKNSTRTRPVFPIPFDKKDNAHVFDFIVRFQRDDEDKPVWQIGHVSSCSSQRPKQRL
jgi:hypothetical protein